MANDILKLYPQYSTQTSDRRKQNLAVEFDRRSGFDRRAQQRPVLDESIKKDLFKINSTVEDTFASFNKNSAAMSAQNKNREIWSLLLSPIPFARRILNIDNNAKDENPVKAAGIGAIAALNVKEDARDLLGIIGRTKSNATEGFHSKYSFFLGTPLENCLTKTDLGLSIRRRLDGTLCDTKLGHKILDVFNIKKQSGVVTKEIHHLNNKLETVTRIYNQYDGSKIAKLIARTLDRIPKLSVIVALALELPSLIKAKAEDKPKQAVNSTLSVICSVGFGALFSALLAPIHPALPVMGLGIGYYVGNKIAKAIGFKLDNNVKSDAG